MKALDKHRSSLHHTRSGNLILAVCSIFFILTTSCNLQQTQTNQRSGFVRTQNGQPVAGATVRIQTTEFKTTSNSDGSFSIVYPQEVESQKLTAWSPGYFITESTIQSREEAGILFELIPHSTEDNPDYIWQTAFHPEDNQEIGCSECHSAAGTSLPYTLPVDEWLLDAHANTFHNERFQTMYLGTDTDGNQSPITQFVSTKDYGTEPTKPDPDQPYFGPGYKLDFPDTGGNCAACHTPAAAINAPYDTDPSMLEGVEAEGITCDFCHKVWNVNLDPTTGLPHQNLPGVLSFEFRRPPEGHQFFAGPLDDVAPGEDVYSPLQTQSQFCAPCHFGSFWDVVVYDSFGEWLRSPYSDPEKGQTCQDCHMPGSGADHFALPERGGNQRDPETIFSHRMPGASDDVLLQNAVSMTVTSTVEDETFNIDVVLVNDRTGHFVPTDSPLRHLILLVRAVDSGGNDLALLAGPVLPEWAGVDVLKEGHYASLPGKVYAKVLAEQWTNVQPTGAYWNPTYLVYDNRLAPFEADLTTFTFAMSNKQEIQLHVQLIYRRAYIELMEQKGWQSPDIIMEEAFLKIAP